MPFFTPPLPPAPGWPDIGYNFLVGEDGHVYTGRGWDAQGAHSQGHNSVAHGVSVIGEFTDRMPSPAALQAFSDLMEEGVNQVCLHAYFSGFHIV